MLTCGVTESVEDDLALMRSDLRSAGADAVAQDLAAQLAAWFSRTE